MRKPFGKDFGKQKLEELKAQIEEQRRIEEQKKQKESRNDNPRENTRK